MSSKRRFTNLRAVQTTVEKLPLVGFTVFWRLAGIRTSHDDLVKALDQANLREFLPKPPTPRIALRRALERWIADRKRALNTALSQMAQHAMHTSSWWARANGHFAVETVIGWGLSRDDFLQGQKGVSRFSLLDQN